MSDIEQVLSEVAHIRNILISADGQSGICFDVAEIKKILKGNGQEGICMKVGRLEHKVNKWLYRFSGATIVLSIFLTLIGIYIEFIRR